MTDSMEFPDECEYQSCTDGPIVGVNEHYVCQEHMQWAFDNYANLIGDLMDNFKRVVP